VARIATRLGLGDVRDPELLAWSIERRNAGPVRITLIVRLLPVAERGRDAVRILSERAAAAPGPIAAELQRLGADRDAAEVRALATRGR
jgi:hypothetical protein